MKSITTVVPEHIVPEKTTTFWYADDDTRYNTEEEAVKANKKLGMYRRFHSLFGFDMYLNEDTGEKVTFYWVSNAKDLEAVEKHFSESKPLYTSDDPLIAVERFNRWVGVMKEDDNSWQTSYRLIDLERFKNDMQRMLDTLAVPGGKHE